MDELLRSTAFPTARRSTSMTMKRLLMLVIAALLAGGDGKATEAVTPIAIAKSIASSGARSTLERIYANRSQWDAVLAGIATGSSEWLSVAKLLKPVSDAGSSEQITIALGEALEHEPERILALAGEGFSLSAICDAPDVDDGRYNSYDSAIAAIDRRILHLKAIAIPKFQQSATACVNTLSAAKVDIARFYGRDH